MEIDRRIRRGNDFFVLFLATIISLFGNAAFAQIIPQKPFFICIVFSGAYLAIWLIWVFIRQNDLIFLRAATILWVFCGIFAIILAFFVYYDVQFGLTFWRYPMLAMEFLYGMPTSALRYATDTYLQYRILSACIATVYAILSVGFFFKKLRNIRANR